MADRPDALPLWTDGNPTKIDEPSLGKRDLGYVQGEKPSPFQMNWLFYYNGLWIQYLDELAGRTTLATYPPETISEGGIISSALTAETQVRYIEGTGGAVTTSNTPFGVAGGWVDGILMVLIGSNASWSVTTPFADIDYGFIINGDFATNTEYGNLTVRWHARKLRWIQEGVN